MASGPGTAAILAVITMVTCCTTTGHIIHGKHSVHIQHHPHKTHSHVDDTPKENIMLDLDFSETERTHSGELVESHVNINQDIEHQDHPHPVGDVESDSSEDDHGALALERPLAGDLDWCNATLGHSHLRDCIGKVIECHVMDVRHCMSRMRTLWMRAAFVLCSGWCSKENTKDCLVSHVLNKDDKHSQVDAMNHTEGGWEAFKSHHREKTRMYAASRLNFLDSFDTSGQHCEEDYDKIPKCATWFLTGEKFTKHQWCKLNHEKFGVIRDSLFGQAGQHV